MFGINGKKFQRQYKKNISDFKDWDQKQHAEDWILYSENLSDQLSLDEVPLSDGELYTVLTSKKAKGKKGSIVAIIKGTQSDKVIEQILKISRKLRQKVKEITLDMAGSMKLIAKRCFPMPFRSSTVFMFRSSPQKHYKTSGYNIGGKPLNWKTIV